MRPDYWLEALAASDDPESMAEHITAARVINALRAEAGQVPAAAGGSDLVTHVYDDLTVTGYGEPYLCEITDARAARRGDATLRVDQAVELYGLHEAHRDLLESNARTMCQVAAAYTADRRGLTWYDLAELAPADLYVLMEQDGNPERPPRNPIALAYRAEHAYHPYLGSRSVHAHVATTGITALPTLAHRGEARLPGLVLHPQSLGSFPELQAEPWRQLTPTTSVRTLYDPTQDRHYKTSFDGQITSHDRLLHRDEAANAVASTNLLVTIAERGLLPDGLHFLPELAWISHSADEYANCLVRGGLADAVPPIAAGAHVVPASSLATPLSFAAGRSFVELMAERTDPVRLLTDITAALVRGYLGLVDLGVSHESHAQNTLLVLDLHQPAVLGICLRDVEALKVDPSRVAERGLPMFHRAGTAATHSQAILDPGQPARGATS